ncbi:sigma-70 family RNA polymerase sigma factor [Aureisphaera sp. CAU 1614]|uniref:Sigma-70 family RNA polymerase sigma factor n=1 Tax=Halomarinibacterium sedimenti TaxID=2857106 RepID=A0A9X1FQ80_9FLAO|nr:sigma-70 family RNA polymerase sigma factor [Halomarinibacterium sedimenti]MAL58907.1 RNA polymerase subunit sigma-70 [Flavobacteriaceae bacterium]MBW2938770.1 sigma-70 family RNA polymerase sigma factor [Halomarinibacterium sedimenti]
MSKVMLHPETWVDRYSDYLYNYTIVRVNDHEVAQDIISDTFLAGLKSKDNFKGEATERTWLISILKRKIIDHYRKINSNKGKAEVRINYNDTDNEGDWLEEQVEDFSEMNAQESMENEELGLAILGCLESINEKQAEIFKLKTIDGVDTETICNEYNITPSNLWVIIHRARKALADCLESNWFK